MNGDRRAARANALFDFLAGTPHAVTRAQMMDALGCSLSSVDVAIRDVRIALGGDDTINLVANVAPGSAPWLYELTGDPEVARFWQVNRLVDLITRARTMAAVAASIRRSLDARTIDGRKAKILAVALSRAIEDLDDLDGWTEPT